MKFKLIFLISIIVRLMSLLSVKDYGYKTWGKSYPEENVNFKNMKLSPEWEEFLKPVMETEAYQKLQNFFTYALKKTQGNIDIFPYPDLVFNSFNYVKPDDIKVVILGQDPYFNFDKNIPQAMGLSFSVPVGVSVPSSLQNIYKNLQKFSHTDEIPIHGNLEFWAYQGVLLLNTALTVQKGFPNSHAKKWEFFTDYIIKKLSDDYSNIAFVLWGGNALKKLDLIDEDKHFVSASSHPSGMSVSKTLGKYPAFENCDHFGKINRYLKSKKKDPIVWKIV